MEGRQAIWDIIKFRNITCPGGISVSLVSSHPETWPKDQISEHIIAAAARTSFNNFDQINTPQKDINLIKRLFKDKHTSPLEMASLTFEIKAPKFVTIQLLRHRTFKFNESSQRYHKVDDGYLHPSTHPSLFIRRQDEKNKQSSLKDQTLADDVNEKVIAIENKLDEIFTMYNELISMGVARECARFCLPIATWSTIVVQADLNNLTKFLLLRLNSDAQLEIQMVARAIFHLGKQVFPIILGSLEESLPQTCSIDDSGFIYA
jgi:thymidylate synthase (FAD)